MAKRTDKLGRQLQRDLGEILDAVSKQLLKGTMVTILEVDLTPDLGLAKVYISLFNSADKAVDLKILNQQVPRIRHYLAGRLKDQVRKIPEVVLILDDRMDNAEHLEQLLSKLRKPK